MEMALGTFDTQRLLSSPAIVVAVLICNRKIGPAQGFII